MPESDPLLFVYGTLKWGMNNDWSRRLWAAASGRFEATLQGRLYLVSSFAALVDSDEPGERVHGEAARVPLAVIEELDEYEGADYERVRRPVRLGDGTAAEAWVYLCVAAIDPATRIVSGWYEG